MTARMIWIAIAAALVGSVAYRVSQVRQANARPAEKPAEAALIRITRVSRADLTERIALTGSVRPENEVDVFAKVPGRLDSLSAEVGDKVRANETLGFVEHKEIGWQAKAADAALAVAKANLDGVQLELDRTQALFKGGSAPQAQLDGARMKLALAQAQLAQAEAAAGLAHQQIENARIASPIRGTVIRRPVNVGMQVGPQSPLFTIQDVEKLKLEASVDAAAFARLAKGQIARVAVDALPGPAFAGEVSLLSPSLDPLTRRAAVELEIDNASGKLLPNMFARAEIAVGHLADALFVPKDAVFEAPGGAVVYRIRDGKAEAVRAHLGAEDGERIAVLDGLAEGDEVAVAGLANLADGAAVKVAANP